MEIQDIRRARLAQLIKDQYGGSQSRFVEATGENQSEVSGLLRVKSFGERKARKLEEKCGLPTGWFDVVAVEETPVANVGPHGATDHPARDLAVAPVVLAVRTEKMALVYVTQRELDLLTHYRRAPEIGKGVIETAAESAAGAVSGTSTAHQF